MVEYRVTMRRSPDISDQEAKQRLKRVYDLLFGLKSHKSTDDGESATHLAPSPATEHINPSSGDTE